MDNEKKQVTYNSSITGGMQVTFDIQQYMNNRARESFLYQCLDTAPMSVMKG